MTEPWERDEWIEELRRWDRRARLAHLVEVWEWRWPRLAWCRVVGHREEPETEWVGYEMTVGWFCARCGTTYYFHLHRGES
jgi:hypothetical protein